MANEVLGLRVTKLEEESERMKHIIDGNGKMGLKTKVALIFWGHWPLGIVIGAMIKGYLEKLVS